MTDEELIYLCAFRYALGRRSYIVYFVCGKLRELCREGRLSQFAREAIIREIDDYKQMFGSLGSNCDANDWEGLQEYLRDYNPNGGGGN